MATKNRDGPEWTVIKKNPILLLVLLLLFLMNSSNFVTCSSSNSMDSDGTGGSTASSGVGSRESVGVGSEPQFDLLMQPSMESNVAMAVTDILTPRNKTPTANFMEHFAIQTTGGASVVGGDGDLMMNVSDSDHHQIQDRWDPPGSDVDDDEQQKQQQQKQFQSSSTNEPITFSRFQLFDPFYDQQQQQQSVSSQTSLLMTDSNETRRSWNDAEDDDIHSRVSPQSPSPLPTPPTNNHFSLSLSPRNSQQFTPKEPIFDDNRNDELNLEFDPLRHNGGGNVANNDNNDDHSSSSSSSSSSNGHHQNSFRPSRQSSNNNGSSFEPMDAMSSDANHNFVVADHILPYMNAYSTNNGEIALQKVPPTMMLTKPVNNEDVFIVHHQHHYPPMFLNPDSMGTNGAMGGTIMMAPPPSQQPSPMTSIGPMQPMTGPMILKPSIQMIKPPIHSTVPRSQGSTGSIASDVQFGMPGGTSSPETTGTNSNVMNDDLPQANNNNNKNMENEENNADGEKLSSVKPKKSKSKKKSKKLQIVYIKVPLLNLMDGKSSTTTTISDGNGGVSGLAVGASNVNSRNILSKLSSAEVDDGDMDTSSEMIDHMTDGEISSLRSTVPPITINNLAAGITLPPKMMDSFNNHRELDANRLSQYLNQQFNHNVLREMVPTTESPLISDQTNAYSRNSSTTTTTSTTTEKPFQDERDMARERNQRETKQMPPPDLHELNERFYYFLMGKLGRNETDFMDLKDIKSSDSSRDKERDREREREREKDKDREKERDKDKERSRDRDKDRENREIKDKIKNKDKYDEADFSSEDKEASGSNQFVSSSLEPLLYNYQPGSNNSGNNWPQEKSLGILPILIQIEEKNKQQQQQQQVSNDQMMMMNQMNNNQIQMNGGNGLAGSHMNDPMMNGDNYNRNNMDRPFFNNNNDQMNNMDSIQSRPNDWSSNISPNSGWQVSKHPVRNVIFHNSKPTTMNMNSPPPPSPPPPFHNGDVGSRMKFGPFSSYMDEERFNNDPMMNGMMSNNYRPSTNSIDMAGPSPTSPTSMNKGNPMFQSASDSHINFFGPMIPNRPGAPLPAPLPAPLNLNQLLNNPNFNYRLFEYWLLRNQMLNNANHHHHHAMNLNKLNRLKMNQDLLAAMQTKMSPKVTLDLEQMFFPYGPGYAYGNYFKMPDKYREAYLRTKFMQAAASNQLPIALLPPLIGLEPPPPPPPTTSSSSSSPTSSQTSSTQQQQQQQQSPNKDISSLALFWNNRDKKRSRSLKNAFSKPFSLGNLSEKSQEDDTAIGGTAGNGNNNSNSSNNNNQANNGNGNGNGNNVNNNNNNNSNNNKRKKSRRNLSKFSGIFG